MSEKVYFSASLYSLEAVKKSVSEYSALAHFSVDEKLDGVTVTISDVHPSYKGVLVDYFCNHVLNETIILIRKEKGGEL